MPIDGLVFAFLLFTSFTAGFIDSVAGGGGLLMLPALFLGGVPPQTALGTSKFASTWGTSMALGTYVYHKKVVWAVAVQGVVFSLVFSFLGSRLILCLDPSLAGKIVVCLLPLGIFLVIFHRSSEKSSMVLSFRNRWLTVPLVCSLLGFYDGFFGPGTGSLYILAFTLFLKMDYLRASGTAKLFNLASNLGALGVFLWNGKVLFELAIPLAVLSMSGSFLGSRLALKYKGVVRVFLMVSLGILMVSLAKKYFF